MAKKKVKPKRPYHPDVKDRSNIGDVVKSLKADIEKIENKKR